MYLNKLDPEKWSEEKNENDFAIVFNGKRVSINFILPNYGEVIVDLEENDFRMDDELSRIIGLVENPSDDIGEKYKVEGITTLNGKYLLVLTFIKNLRIDHNHVYSQSCVLTQEELRAVQEWIGQRQKVVEIFFEQKKQTSTKEAKIQELFKAHGLDDASVAVKRQVLLKEYGF